MSMAPPIHADERKGRRMALPAIAGAIFGAAAMYAATSTPGRLWIAAPFVSTVGGPLEGPMEGLFAGLSMLEDRLREGQRQFNDLMDGVHSPQYKITNETKAYTLTMQIPPEVQPEEVEFEISGSVLAIKYEHRSKTGFMSSFSQIGGIPRDIDADLAYAEKADEEGILTIVLPKMSSQPKKTFRATKKASAKAQELKARLVPLGA